MPDAPPPSRPHADAPSPLEAFRGERPPAPPWHARAMAMAPQRSVTEVEGAQIETLAWGERGRPGLLLVHGGGAHADWWAHIAPFLAGERRVAALSLSGAGASDRREAYDIAQYARELAAVARAAGLYEAGPPVFAAHSFGSRPLYAAAADPQLAPSLAIVVDAAIAAPGLPDFPTAAPRPLTLYDSFEAALARFRLMPLQPCDNLYLVDYIGRRSIREVDGPEGRGWSWRHDPRLWDRLQGGRRVDLTAALQAIRCPLAYIYGERSYIVANGSLSYTRSLTPPGTPFVEIPDAAHHVFLDQPLAFVSALRALLAVMDR